MRWALLALLATPAAAERFDCVMDGGQRIIFEVDPSLFVNEFNPYEPIPRTRTIVQFDGDRFSAEPFRVADLRGFAAENPDGSTTMFVVAPDGDALMTNRQSGSRIKGRCKRP